VALGRDDSSAVLLHHYFRNGFAKMMLLCLSRGTVEARWMHPWIAPTCSSPGPQCQDWFEVRRSRRCGCVSPHRAVLHSSATRVSYEMHLDRILRNQRLPQATQCSYKPFLLAYSPQLYPIEAVSDLHVNVTPKALQVSARSITLDGCAGSTSRRLSSSSTLVEV
jgi:hypothetical protein